MRLLVLIALAGCASSTPAISLEPPRARALCCLRRDGATVLEVCAPDSADHRAWCLRQERAP